MFKAKCLVLPLILSSVASFALQPMGASFTVTNNSGKDMTLLTVNSNSSGLKCSLTQGMVLKSGVSKQCTIWGNGAAKVSYLFRSTGPVVPPHHLNNNPGCQFNLVYYRTAGSTKPPLVLGTARGLAGGQCSSSKEGAAVLFNLTESQ